MSLTVAIRLRIVVMGSNMALLSFVLLVCGAPIVLRLERRPFIPIFLHGHVKACEKPFSGGFLW